MIKKIQKIRLFSLGLVLLFSITEIQAAETSCPSENLISTKTSKKMDNSQTEESEKKATPKSNDSGTFKMLKLLIPQTLR